MHNPAALLARAGSRVGQSSIGGLGMAGRGLRLWSSLSGLVFVVLAVVGSALLFDGPSDSSPAKMAAGDGSDSNRWHINLGWILTGPGLFALVWVVAAPRARVRGS